MPFAAFRITALMLMPFVALGASSPVPLPYPSSPAGSVTDSYFGTTVADPYRWLEDGNDPNVKAWAATQTKVATDFLTSQPTYAAYHQRIAELSKTSTRRFGLTIRGGTYVYLRQTPPQAQPQLVARTGIGGAERVLFDPAKAGSPAPAIETVAVSPDGTKVAFTTQLGGSENETIHVVDTIARRLLPDTIAHAGGGTSPVAIAWDGDSRGFLHTAWPRNPDGTYPTAGILIWHHRLGSAPASVRTSSAKDSRRRRNSPSPLPRAARCKS
jgi:prolyl oligopeptidase